MFDFTDLNSCVSLISSSIESEDRKKRKKILEELQCKFSQLNIENPELLTLFDAIRQVLWNSVSDKAETVRDVTIDILKELFKKMPSNNKYLEEIIPIILFRFEGEDTKEPSEEIRLKLVELLNVIIENCKNDIEVYTSDIVKTLAITLVDKYPKVRQESAKSCILLSQLSGYALYENGQNLVKPLIASFKHNHSRTRISALEGLSAVLKNANWKNIQAQFVFGSLGERLFDDVPGVRMAIVELLSLWLVTLRDRYSYFSRLVPLMLSCLTDEQPEVAEKAWVGWSAAGRQYLSENENDLKDKMDFLDEKPVNYPLEVERPNLGCRTLVQRHTMQILTPLVEELSDWQPRVCIKASHLLVQLVIHAEAELTQHSETLLLAMYKVTEDKGNVVPTQCRLNVEKAAEYMGFFISPATWHLLVFPVVDAEPSPGKLFILAALLRGCQGAAMDSFASQLAVILCDPSICATMQTAMQLEALKCCRALLDNVTLLNQFTTKNLLLCLYYVTSAVAFEPDKAPLAQAGKDCLSLLAEKAHESLTMLTEENISGLADCLAVSVDGWSEIHPDFRLLLYLLAQSGAVWFSQEEKIFNVLKEALKLGKGDVNVKSRLFAALAALLDGSDFTSVVGEKEFDKFTVNAVKELIMPNLVWRAGLSAEKLRTVVLTALSCVTRYQSSRTVPIQLPCDELLPILVGCVRDVPVANRRLSLDIIHDVTKIASALEGFTGAMFTSAYSQVVCRLDDVDSNVRNYAIVSLHGMFLRLSDEVSETSHSAIFGHIVTAMLPYLDDDDEEFRNAICAALKTLSSRAPRTVMEKLTSAMANKYSLKSQDLCQQILDSLPQSSK